MQASLKDGKTFQFNSNKASSDSDFHMVLDLMMSLAIDCERIVFILSQKSA